MKKAKSILKAGGIVGSLDIVAACLYYFIKTGNHPLNVLKFVASGAYGKQAASGGVAMYIAGLAFHYVIAFSFTTFFFLLYPKLNTVSRQRVPVGIVYGLFIWAVMNLIIVPLSQVAPRPFNAVNALINLVILILCIGIPLSYMAYAYYNKVEHANAGGEYLLPS